MRTLQILRWPLSGLSLLLVLAIAGWSTAAPEPARESPKPTAAPHSDHPRHKKKGVVKIATIGNAPPRVDADTPPADLVRRMIAFWKGRFAQVLPDCPDLIVVPEACDRPQGLTHEQLLSYYKFRGNTIRDFFAQVAKEHHCYMVYSAARQVDDGTWRNSSTLINRQGKVVGTYNKNHPTIGEIEQGIVPGRDAPVIECDFGRVALAICFDLNFTPLRARYAAAKPDLILFSSMYHGGLMQAYWAYACRSHFVGAITRSCPSQIRNPLGEVVATTTNYFDFAVARVNLDCALVHLDHNWQHLRELKQKYGRQVTITDPGYLGAVLVTSEHPSVSVEEMLDQFGIERLDDYFNRSLGRQRQAREP
jgi:predicted amidohydrolase